MKKRKLIPILALTSLLVLAIVLATVNSGGMIPSAMAEGTQDIVNLVKTDSNEAYGKIRNNLDKVMGLKAQLEQSKIDGKPVDLNAFVKNIEAVTKSYESLANQRDNIKESLLNKVSKIQDMQKRIDSEVAKLNANKADYASKLHETSSNPEIQRTRQKALTKAITYVDKEIALWQQFKAIEQDINTELLGIQETLDEFLSVIESSAILFREGLNLLQLQQDINDALSLFTVDLPQIKQLSAEMEGSWDNLDFLVNSLTSISLTIK
jgi:chromosome segregation ATPase